MSDPQIYVASLSDYNAGRLHGTWITITEYDTAETIQAEIDEMLEQSKELTHDEWAIHDTDGFQGISIGESEPLDRIVALAEGLRGDQPGAYVAWINNNNGHAGDYQDFLDSFRGEYDSMRSYGQEQWEESHSSDWFKKNAPELEYCIDWEEVGENACGWTADAGMGHIYVFID